MDKPKKKWYKRWWAIIIWIILVLIILGILFGEDSTTPQKSTQTVNKPDYDLEISIDEIIDIFSELSEVQQEEKFKQFNGKTIKTSIIADKVNEATLSSQLVVLQMSGLTSCTAKAFFPKEEKGNLLKVNLGDTITFSGKLTSYKFGFASCITFENSKLIDINKGSGESDVQTIGDLKDDLEISKAYSLCGLKARSCANGDVQLELSLRTECSTLLLENDPEILLDFADGMC